MKKLLWLLPLFVLAAFALPEGELSKKEKKFAAKHLKNTYKQLAKKVKGLSEAQLNFKPTADAWSVKECVYHLAISETNLWGWIQGTLSAPANPDKRAGIKMTDEQLLAGITDRSNKVKTQESFEPKNAKWNNITEALAAMDAERQKHIDYMKNAPADMRNHVAEQTPLGPLDAYQLVLLMSAHTTRHMKQIEEVMASPGFPAN